MSRELLIEELRNAFDKASWHGANLMGALRGATPAQAAIRMHGRHSIWEQLLHAAYWKHRVLRKFGSKSKFARKGSDWPAAPTRAGAAEWKADLEMMRGLHAQLVALVAALPQKQLDSRTRWLLHGAAAHDVYHAGQIKLLRRMIAASSELD
jgi:hypothetical protein